MIPLMRARLAWLLFGNIVGWTWRSTRLERATRKAKDGQGAGWRESEVVQIKLVLSAVGLAAGGGNGEGKKHLEKGCRVASTLAMGRSGRHMSHSINQEEQSPRSGKQSQIRLSPDIAVYFITSGLFIPALLTPLGKWLTLTRKLGYLH